MWLFVGRGMQEVGRQMMYNGIALPRKSKVARCVASVSGHLWALAVIYIHIPTLVKDIFLSPFAK